MRACFVLAALAAGCSSTGERIDFQRAPIRSMNDCPDAGDDVVKKVCIQDDQGQFYDPFTSADGPGHRPGTDVLVVPAGRKLSIVYVFADAYVPASGDLGGDSTKAYDAAINVTANGSSGPCCSEDKESNRVASSASMQGNTMTLSLTDVQPVATQVATILDFQKLYASRIAPNTCTVPAQACSWFAQGGGFAVRFYVGSEPPRDSSIESPTSGH
jgi:hypothetical protein